MFFGTRCSYITVDLVLYVTPASLPYSQRFIVSLWRYLESRRIDRQVCVAIQ